MLKSNLSNLILSKLNIDKVKAIFGNAPILSIFFKLGSQVLIDYSYPTHIFIESTRACNLKCKYCPRNIGPLRSGHMDYNLFTKIIDEATNYGRRNFCLHMLGEPLLYPRITDMVQYIKKANNNHSILFTTNGYFLDDFKTEVFLENNLDKITFSLFSLESEKNKMLTGDDNITKVINNVKDMVALKKAMRSKTKIYIRFLACEENENEIPQLRTTASSLGVPLEIRYTHNYSGIIEDNYTSKHIFKKRYPCYHLWFSPAITWDGKIVLCCNDWDYSEILADIQDSTLAKVWQGERLRQLRGYHLAGEYDKVPLCAKCNVWSMYPDIFFGAQKVRRF